MSRKASYVVIGIQDTGQTWLSQVSAVDPKNAVDQAMTEWTQEEPNMQSIHISYVGKGRIGDNEIDTWAEEFDDQTWCF